jgi:hypothetical protein
MIFFLEVFLKAKIGTGRKPSKVDDQYIGPFYLYVAPIKGENGEKAMERKLES